MTTAYFVPSPSWSERAHTRALKRIRERFGEAIHFFRISLLNINGLVTVQRLWFRSSAPNYSGKLSAKRDQITSRRGCRSYRSMKWMPQAAFFPTRTVLDAKKSILSARSIFLAAWQAQRRVSLSFFLMATSDSIRDVARWTDLDFVFRLTF